MTARYVIYKGQLRKLRLAVELAGNRVSSDLAQKRIKELGWPVDRALETPARPQGGNRAVIGTPDQKSAIGTNIPRPWVRPI